MAGAQAQDPRRQPGGSCLQGWMELEHGTGVSPGVHKGPQDEG